ncbi:MAG: glycosyltransferase [Bacteroidota bacterium]|nr:glycosyltransferase [Bacteroidota bacterium]
MNVLELIDGGFIGGGQTHILSLVKCLDKNKFNVIIAASGKGEFKKLVFNGGFNFKNIELPKFYRSKFLKELDKIVKDNSIDIIHSHGGVAGMYARYYKKNYNSVKIIHTIHGIHYIHSSNFFKKMLSLSMEQFLVSFTDKFICVSETDYELAVKNKIASPEKTIVIKNGIDLEKYKRKTKDIKLLEKLKLKQDDFIIGNISRFDYQKNQRYIITNTKDIMEKFPEIKILLIGDGRLTDDCRKSAEKLGYHDRIIFTGEVINPEDYYSLFDIYIFPSLWEGLSISLIEAIASSNCILASNIPANEELIKNNSTGFTFDLKNENEFIHKLEQLIGNKSLRDLLSENAKKNSSGYSENIMTKKIEQEYLKLTV